MLKKTIFTILATLTLTFGLSLTAFAAPATTIVGSPTLGYVQVPDNAVISADGGDATWHYTEWCWSATDTVCLQVDSNVNKNGSAPDGGMTFTELSNLDNVRTFLKGCGLEMYERNHWLNGSFQWAPFEPTAYGNFPVLTETSYIPVPAVDTLVVYGYTTDKFETVPAGVPFTMWQYIYNGNIYTISTTGSEARTLLEATLVPVQ